MVISIDVRENCVIGSYIITLS